MPFNSSGQSVECHARTNETRHAGFFNGRKGDRLGVWQEFDAIIYRTYALRGGAARWLRTPRTFDEIILLQFLKSFARRNKLGEHIWKIDAAKAGRIPIRPISFYAY